MPLRLGNAIALPTCPQQPQKKKTGRSRDSRLTTRLDRCQRTSRPERLAAGRDQIGKVGDIVSESTGDFISVRLGDFVGIRNRRKEYFANKDGKTKIEARFARAGYATDVVDVEAFQLALPSLALIDRQINAAQNQLMAFLKEIDRRDA